MRRRTKIRLAYLVSAVCAVALGISTYVSSERVFATANAAVSIQETETDDTTETVEEEPMSDPASTWVKGTIPHLYQIDPQWKDIPYLDGTIEDTACGPSVLTMVYAGLTGNTDYDIPAMCEFVVNHGYVADGMTSWALFDEGAGELGLQSQQVPVSEENLVSALEAGKVVVVSVKPGDFTDKGHFMVITGIAPNGSIWINDPNSVENSSHTWSVSRVLKQVKGMWVIGAAE